MEMEQNFLNKKLKTITAYYGELVLDGEEDTEDMADNINDTSDRLDNDRVETDNGNTCSVNEKTNSAEEMSSNVSDICDYGNADT